jgi:16S rRNA (cytosine967-C5)-methyltransferase
VLVAVAGRAAYANLALPALLRERELAGRDAALATELTYGTLRGQGTYDAILAVCSDRPPVAIDMPLLQVLRLGVHQLLATRVRSHAAVATSVSLAREIAGAPAAGFVNAVLRRVASRDLAGWLAIAAPDRAADPAGYLAVTCSYPRWIVEAFAAALGETPPGPETEAALRAGNEAPRVTLAVVPGLADTAELAAAGAELARWSPFGGYLRDGDPAGVGLVAQRRAAVQDEASQLAVLALYRSSGRGGAAPDRWLDLCAGPGGKARLLAALGAPGGGHLLAADLRQHRARLARRALAGQEHATAVVTADATMPAWRAGIFGAVLADVPCSGLGALRRRPEARWRRQPADIAALTAAQRALLRSALEAARPGGVVAYVTCSPHLAETRDVVTAILAERGDASLIDAPALLPEVPDLGCPAAHREFAQFWPHRHGTDAIFIALLRRHSG